MCRHSDQQTYAAMDEAMVHTDNGLTQAPITIGTVSTSVWIQDMGHYSYNAECIRGLPSLGGLPDNWQSQSIPPMGGQVGIPSYFRGPFGGGTFLDGGISLSPSELYRRLRCNSAYFLTVRGEWETWWWCFQEVILVGPREHSRSR